MQALFLVFFTVFEKIASVFTQKVVFRLTVVTAIIGIFVGAVALLVTAIGSAIGGFVHALPTGALSIMYDLLPCNISTCITGFLAAKGGAFIYVQSVKIAKIKVAAA